MCPTNTKNLLQIIEICQKLLLLSHKHGKFGQDDIRTKLSVAQNYLDTLNKQAAGLEAWHSPARSPTTHKQEVEGKCRAAANYDDWSF